MHLINKRWGTIISCFVALMLGSAASAALSQGGKGTVENLVRILGAGNGTAADQKTFAEAAKFIDYESMSQRALGQAEWAKISPSQRSKFIAALRTVVEQRYYPRWHRLFAKGTITYGQESTVNGDTVLQTSLKINKKSQQLAWCMAKHAGDLKVVSLGLNDKDLLNKLHQRVITKLKKSDFDSLVVWLKNKAPHEDDDSEKGDNDAISTAKK
jgi:ABC-type transporter MlaC component